MLHQSSTLTSAVPTQQPPPFFSDATTTATVNRNSSSSSSLAFPLFLPQPMTGMSLWDQVLLGAVRHREAAIRDTHAEVKQMKKLNKQIEKVYEEKKKRRQLVEETRNATHVRIGKLMAKAVDKCWGRAKRGYEASWSLACEIEKQQSAEKRQASFLKDTERLTAFLAESFRSLAASSATGEDAAGVSAAPSFGHHSPNLSLLNTLNGARPLRPYQNEALAFFINLYNNGLNGLCGLEMGLGKSVLTLSLIAYFAEFKQDWGPHLIVVPASILANWELECMRWAPGFKVIKYHGSAKERERLRKGWTAEGSFHICLASYSTVVHDRNIFKRRPWGFLILDEAHNIKNWKSQNWQVLFELQSSYRLLLTGTPLQTSVMELWALLRFIVPPQIAIHAAQKHLQSSSSSSCNNNNNNNNSDDHDDHDHEDHGSLAAAFGNMEDFQRWFSDPLTAMVQGQATFDSDVVLRLQALLRPFFFRRVKSEVESQLPPKKEVVILCPLSKRQRQLYQEFLSLASTKETLACGSYFGVVRVLLSLRKVCNHPDLFAERPVASPLCLDPHYDRLVARVPRKVFLNDIDSCWSWSCCCSSSASSASSSASSKTQPLTVSCGVSEYLWNLFSNSSSNSSSSHHTNKNLFLYIQDLNLQDEKKLMRSTAARNNDRTSVNKSSTSPSSLLETFIRQDIEQRFTIQNNEAAEFFSETITHRSKRFVMEEDNDDDNQQQQQQQQQQRHHRRRQMQHQQQEQDCSFTPSQTRIISERVSRVVEINKSRIQQLKNGFGFFVPAAWCCSVEEANLWKRLTRISSTTEIVNNANDNDSSSFSSCTMNLPTNKNKNRNYNNNKLKNDEKVVAEKTSSYFTPPHEVAPVFKYLIIPSAAQRIEACSETLKHFVVVVPKVWARPPMLSCALPLRLVANPKLVGAGTSVLISSSSFQQQRVDRRTFSTSSVPLPVADPHDIFFETVRRMRFEQHQNQQSRRCLSISSSPSSSSSSIRSFEPGWSLLSHYFHFPETRWVVQDCGKFFVLLPLFKRLSSEGHRVLIFTQFTGMLAILERFLAFLGLPYLRLDSTISPDERQFRVEQFNRDTRIFAMVLSTRAGGIGLNLIGADTVVFFDSDWNPAMDLQAQDRCHRIGQTRAVTIYRLVSEHTVEVNIVKKARQRKILNNLVIRSGQFNLDGALSGKKDGGCGDEDDEQGGAGTGMKENHNAMTRETLLNFFHDRDGDKDDNDDELVVGGQQQHQHQQLEQQQQQREQGTGSRSVADDENDDWVKATAAAEDVEDRAAGSAAAAEQKKAEAADWLESQGELASFFDAHHLHMHQRHRDGDNGDDASAGNKGSSLPGHHQRHFVKRSFATALASWPPPLNTDSGVEQRLQVANRNATNTAVEGWAANTLPFFDRLSASAIRAKVRAK